SARLPRELDLRFDPQFNFSGAEDIDYFIQAYECGCAAVCVDEALVFEVTTAQRECWRGKFYRDYTNAINKVLLFKKHSGTNALQTFAHFSLRIAGKFSLAFLALLLEPFCPSRKDWKERFIHRMTYILGFAAGMFGAKGRRYRNPDEK
ncbi:MAG: glycosyltransferase family 2 protein, partial [Candidatus Eutrophobiaceae bacterium]